jgi:membrane fusion protein (multidrug efflux system)
MSTTAPAGSNGLHRIQGRSGQPEKITMTVQPALEAPSVPHTVPEAHQAAIEPPSPKPRHGRWSFVSLGLAAAGLVGAALYLYVPSFYEVGTNDAYVDAHAISVVPKVAAYVSALLVNDNSKIAKGDLLIELDPRDFQVAVDSTMADLKSAEANAANIDAQLHEQQAVIEQNASAIVGDQAMLEFFSAGVTAISVTREHRIRYGAAVAAGAIRDWPTAGEPQARSGRVRRLTRPRCGARNPGPPGAGYD